MYTYYSSSPKRRLECIKLVEVIWRVANSWTTWMDYVAFYFKEKIYMLQKIDKCIKIVMSMIAKM
jgi:hypothetical protein